MTTLPTPSTDTQGEAIRRFVSILVVLLLAGTSLWILAPFLPALVWAATIAVATWPLLLLLQRRLGNRRWPATAAMTLLMLLLFFVPVLVIVWSIVDHASDVAQWGTELARSGLPPAPAWMHALPLVGEKLAAKWNGLSAMSGDQVVAAGTPWLGQASAWLLARAGGLVSLAMQFLLTALITAILFQRGEQAAAMAISLARKLSDDRGEELMVLAGRSVRSVALGVVVTALMQTLLSGLVLLATGVPGAMLLTGLVLVLCLAQVGPFLVLIPAAAWLYWAGHGVAATVLVVAMLIIGTLDNVVRPMLIKRGADLPLLLVFAGVIGGMLAFGILGIFVGPVILAVTFTLLEAWVKVPGETGAGGLEGV